MDSLQEKIQNTLRTSVDTTPERVSRFFKTGPGEYAEFDKFLGITTPTLRHIANQHRDLPLPVIKHFLHSEYNEERLFALIILVMQYQKKEACDRLFQFYLTHIKYVNNWNLVDQSAHLILGAHVWQRDRSILQTLVKSTNLWERRISIVATWYFIKQHDFDETFHITTCLLDDREDLIHKACGWMLREVGKLNEAPLLHILDAHAHRMPRTMLRYAIEKFPQSLRKHYMKLDTHLES